MEDSDLELETLFNEAADIVQNKGATAGLQDQVLLKLYGLYKISTVGPCQETQPSIFNPKGRSKWSAWKSSSNMSKEEAMQEYVNVVKEAFNWEPLFLGSDSTQTGLGNAVSTFVIPSDFQGQEDCDIDNVFAWAKDSDLTKLAQWVQSKPSDFNLKDANGLTPLIWAIDRNRLEACKLLLDAGADPSVKDNEGISPLEYAETCEHNEIINILKQRLL